MIFVKFVYFVSSKIEIFILKKKDKNIFEIETKRWDEKRRKEKTKSNFQNFELTPAAPKIGKGKNRELNVKPNKTVLR